MMTIIAIIQILSIPEIGAQPELDLSLAPYKSDLVKIPLDIHTPINLTPENEEIFENIVKDTTFSPVSEDLGFVLSRKSTQIRVRDR